MKNTFFLIIFCVFTHAIVQSQTLSNSIDGAYTALFAERGSKDKLIQLSENRGIQMLAIAACEQCLPMIFTYNKELSHKIDNAVFNNNVGYYVYSYDEQSFIIFMVSGQAGQDFMFINFYSKNPSKVATMTRKKLEVAAQKLHKQL